MWFPDVNSCSTGEKEGSRDQSGQPTTAHPKSGAVQQYVRLMEQNLWYVYLGLIQQKTTCFILHVLKKTLIADRARKRPLLGYGISLVCLNKFLRYFVFIHRNVFGGSTSVCSGWFCSCCLWFLLNILQWRHRFCWRVRCCPGGGPLPDCVNFKTLVSVQFRFWVFVWRDSKTIWEKFLGSFPKPVPSSRWADVLCWEQCVL